LPRRERLKMKKMARRTFLGHLTLLLMLFPKLTFGEKKARIKDPIVVVNGWVLKRSDLGEYRR